MRFLAGLFLLFGVVASPAEDGSPAIAYFEWLAIQPNAYKRIAENSADNVTLVQSKKLALSASRPETIRFLERYLERLSLDPICQFCGLYASAYASGRPDLQSRAIAALKKMVYGPSPLLLQGINTITKSDERFVFFFDQLAQLALATPKPRESAVVFGRLLAELRGAEPQGHVTPFYSPPFDNELRPLYYPGRTDPVSQIKREIAESLFDELEKSEPNRRRFLDALKEPPKPNRDAITHSLNALSRLAYSPPLDPQDPAWNLANNAISVVMSHSFDPEVQNFLKRDDGRIIDALGASLGAKAPLPERDRWRTPMAMVNWNALLLAAYATGDPQVQNKALNALRVRAGAKESSLFFAVSGWANPDLKEAALSLLKRLALAYEPIKQDLERIALPNPNFSDVPGPVAQWMATELIKTLKGNEYWQRLSAPPPEDALADVLARLREKGIAGLYGGRGRPALQLLFENASDPQVITVLNEKLNEFWLGCGQRFQHPQLLSIAYASGAPELKRRSLALLRVAVTRSGLARCSTNPPSPHLEDEAISTGERFARFFEQFANGAHSQACAQTTGDLFAELGYGYEVIGEKIETSLDNFWLAAQPPPNYVLAARRLVTRLKGEEYWNQLVDKAEEKRRRNNPSAFEQAENQLFESFSGRRVPPYLAPRRDFEAKLFTNANAPEVREFLAKRLHLAVLHPHYRNWLLAAFASNDEELRDLAVAMAERQIRSGDGSSGERFKAYLEDVVSGLTAAQVWPQKAEALYPLALEFLSSLKIPYHEIQKELEAVANWKEPSIEKRLAFDLVARKKGPEYAAALERLRPQKPQANLYINGGYSPTSNFSNNEEDLLSFYHNLFQSDAVVLSGGGDVSVGQASEHDWQGRFLKGERLDIDQNYRAATVQNFELTLQSLALNKPKELTIVYGGHGDQNGFSFWGEQPVSWTQLRRLYDRVPADTRVKSLFLQCYGGSTLVARGRQAPKSVASLEKFAAFYYPKNRCSLALASEDQLGQYYYRSHGPNEPGGWQNSAWSALFARVSNPSLAQMKEELLDDSGFSPTPTITSDYFLEDVSVTLCAESRRLADLKKHGPEVDRWPAQIREQALARSDLLKFDQGSLSRVEEACAGLPLQAIYQRRKQDAAELNRGIQELYTLLIEVNRDWLKTEFPEFAREPGALPDVDVDQIHAKYLAAGKETGLSSGELYDLMKVLATPNLHATTLTGAFSRSQKFIHFFNKRFLEFLQAPANRANFRQVVNLGHGAYRQVLDNPDLLEQQDYRNRLLFTDFFEQVHSRYAHQTSAERKQQEKDLRRLERDLIAPLIGELAALRSVRPYYQSLNACEASPLRNE